MENKSKVDFEALKRSKKAKSKIRENDIVLKHICPYKETKCTKGCEYNDCKMIEL